MINPSILSLGVAACATCLSVTTKEEIVKVATGCVAILAGFLALCYAPWVIKVLVIAMPIIIERLKARSSKL
ncbi:riboflavin synthase subunit alpha [Picosynechococcus sp. PCC 7003]|uniref:riboflavin synthase subunit alpha n=1 Tax=Picosynechococcus sp. PCC 7003 TaxID=374981 RepID=UPI0008103ED2|nr:riboflavin synthase subunit alpha [Picosynechococcus sp. PCC 7003]ANV83583.1 riboflavin synthase subunit alpha [Picosynechococcus sp. PCC 7003]